MRNCSTAPGTTTGALEHLGNASGSFRADGLQARIELEGPNGDRPRVSEAFAALDGGDVEGGLDILFEELAAASGDDRERLRKAIVAVLDELGVEHPLAREARRRLAAALYEPLAGRRPPRARGRVGAALGLLPEEHVSRALQQARAARRGSGAR